MSEVDRNSAGSVFPAPAQRHVPSLVGTSGRLRLHVGDTMVAILEIRDGNVDLRPGDGEADAVAICDSEETITAIGRGALNPVVAALQNRLQISGDRALAIRVIRALHSTPPEGTKP